jgi:hypothetical protein
MSRANPRTIATKKQKLFPSVKFKEKNALLTNQAKNNHAKGKGN